MSLPIQNTASSTATAAFGLAIVIFLDNSCRPKVNGGPINLMLNKLLSVYTSICCFVSTACIKVEPLLNLKSPAVFVAVGVKSVKDSWEPNRIRRGSCVVVPIVFVPNTMTCLSRSETKTCFAIVGASEAPVKLVILTAAVPSPLVLSQWKIAPSLGFINKSSPKLSWVHERSSAVVPLAAGSPQPKVDKSAL